MRAAARRISAIIFRTVKARGRGFSMRRVFDAGTRPADPSTYCGRKQIGEAVLTLRRRKVGFAEGRGQRRAPAAGTLARHCSPHPSRFAFTNAPI